MRELPHFCILHKLPVQFVYLKGIRDEELIRRGSIYENRFTGFARFLSICRDHAVALVYRIGILRIGS